MSPGLPILKSARIDADLPSHLSLGQASRPANRNEAFSNRTGRRRGIITQEPMDGRDLLNGGLGFVAFSVCDGQSTDPDLFGSLP